VYWLLKREREQLLLVCGHLPCCSLFPSFWCQHLLVCFCCCAAVLFAAAEGGDLAEYAALDVPLEEVLAEGLRRLNNQDTWKVWQFDGQEFYDADSFRAHVTQHHIRPELLHLLPKDDPKGLERPAEAALRQRMTDLLQQVQLNSRQAQEEQQGAGGSSGSGGGGSSGQSGRGRRAPKSSPEQASSLLRDANVEMISTMLEALEKEHEHLYQSLLRPITSCVCEMLPVRSCAG
jgi:uncharacterized membrane protein YgcG